MALTNRDRVGRALELLAEGLRPFVVRELEARYGRYWVARATEGWEQPIQEWEDSETPRLDAYLLLKLLGTNWREVFQEVLGFAERNYVSELRTFRNEWAHGGTFDSNDAYRALDTAERLLEAVSAPQAEEVGRMKQELLRVRYDEQLRAERRKERQATLNLESGSALPAWRDVVRPHPDVASGRFQQAEFAADLWQVHVGTGPEEYADPVEFFRRTYLTESLRALLRGALSRLTSGEGDPVVELKTSFGGGKTHSMLALYHALSGRAPGELPGVEELAAQEGLSELPRAKRVVLVGTRISPGNPAVKPDGTRVRTLWGELAYQLGGREAFERIRLDDENATNPGERLNVLLADFGPALILIDEWVAYARQLHDDVPLPGGTFQTQFTFAQALTEAVASSDRSLLVVSLPASDAPVGSPSAAEDAEVGGTRGLQALQRLQQAIGRVNAPWKPASAEESFEIVRRRLFEPMTAPESFRARDLVANRFRELYEEHPAEFPPEARERSYEDRIRRAYPVHPELFDRLYQDWSTLPKFQRTRGVLRLMATVIHTLWEREHRSPLILPCHVPLDEDRVRFELKRYLPDQWDAVIDHEVDGEDCLPLQVDRESPHLGRVHAARRVARAIFLGSAPLAGAANQGLDERRIRLACVLPGEQPSHFSDAVNKLAKRASYLFQDGTRFWFSTQMTLNRRAEDYAEDLRNNPEAVEEEIRARVEAAAKGTQGLKVHVFPDSSEDVPDDLKARLVILRPRESWERNNADNEALRVAREMVLNRGTSPRNNRNALVFLAADSNRVSELEEAVRWFLAWRRIQGEAEGLNLTAFQVRQAESQLKEWDRTVGLRIAEAYQWALAPYQEDPKATDLEWRAERLTGQDPLVQRALKRLKSDELLLSKLGPARLRMELDRVPLWDPDHKDRVEIAKLAEHFARYPYLPRLESTAVLAESIASGVALLTWEKDSFAFAEHFDEEARRFVGLVAGESISLDSEDLRGLLVRPDAARAQLELEAGGGTGGTKGGSSEGGGSTGDGGDEGGHGRFVKRETADYRRFHGTLALDHTRPGPAAMKVGEEILSLLASLPGARIEVRLDIEARFDGGATPEKVRAVLENARTLGFEPFGFEEE